jgi:sugar/nucleoside kinase (ribokinase family)
LRKNKIMKKVLGIGNALVDILIRIDDDKILEELELPRGSMQLVDANRSARVLEATRQFEKTLASGGSAANTIAGIAELGIPTSFIGKINKDEMGGVFKNDLEKSNINPLLLYSETPSGTAATLISKDSERTFATHLGAAVELSAEDLTDEFFAGHDYFYIEGYLVQNHAMLEKAVSLAKKHNQKIFLDLASYNVVEENIDFLKYIVKNYVDVVFANEEEAKAFTGKTPEEAIHELASYCEIAIVKIGKKGSMIKSGEAFHKVGIIDVTSVDTTGAGDQYAAGFMYGYSKDYDLKTCGKIASIMSGKVIEHYGARILPTQWSEIKEQIAALS